MAFALLFLQFLPNLLLWNQAYIRIHDTLEGIDYQNLFAAGKTFDYSAGAKIEQVMNGLPRAAVKSGWSFIALWHWLFGLYGGYIFNYVLVHTVAFLGMNLLLRDYFLPYKHQIWLRLGLSLCFGWLPVFSMLGLTVAGQPLMAWAFLRLGPGQQRKLPWLAITLFPFYSDIVWAGLPVLAFGGFLLLRNWRETSRPSLPVLFATIWLAVLYVAVNWQLFQISFWPAGFISHRAEYDYFYNKALHPLASLEQVAMVFFTCYHHVGVFVSAPILLAFGLTRRRFGSNKLAGQFFYTLLICSAFYGFYNYVVWLAADYFPLLKSFKFERAIILMPLIWLLLFAIVLPKIANWNPRLATWFLAAQFAVSVFAQDEFTQNLRQLAGQPRKPNFSAFFDEKLFSKIDTYIGLPKPSYRVVCLGMHPSVAQYNGFFTLDRHASLYDLRYKHQFREIMAGELSKSSVLQKEFDLFGNRCYLFSAELGKEYNAYICGKSAPSICELDINAAALCAMGGRYIFSAVEIEEAAGLCLAKVFEGKYWRVYLYKVDCPDFME